MPISSLSASCSIKGLSEGLESRQLRAELSVLDTQMASVYGYILVDSFNPPNLEMCERGLVTSLSGVQTSTDIS